jgi:hypothetical protein
VGVEDERNPRPSRVSGDGDAAGADEIAVSDVEIAEGRAAAEAVLGGGERSGAAPGRGDDVEVRPFEGGPLVVGGGADAAAVQSGRQFEVVQDPHYPDVTRFVLYRIDSARVERGNRTPWLCSH